MLFIQFIKITNEDIIKTPFFNETEGQSSIKENEYLVIKTCVELLVQKSGVEINIRSTWSSVKSHYILA